MKTTEQFAKEVLDKYMVTLISEYTGAHNKVKFLCSNNHELEATATNLLQRGYKCKECIHGRKIQPKILWTAANIAKLQSLISANTALDDISLHFNTTNAAINNVIADNNLSRPKTNESYSKLVGKLLEQGRELVSKSYYGTHALVEVKCKNNHLVQQQASNIIYHDSNCPKCFHVQGSSKSEVTLLEFIKANYNGWIIENDRDILEGKELDIVLPDIGLAIEYNGGFWHSEAKVPNDYHLSKTKAVEAFGYKLIHVHESKWISRQGIVKSRLLNILGKSTKIFARNCELRKLANFPKQFLDANHIQGAGAPTGINYGLYYSNELMAVMTFSKSRYRKEYEYELVRYVSKTGIAVVGGASKLLKRFEQDYKPKSVISYAARDFSTGNLYIKLGFDYVASTEPGYFYVKRGQEFSRHSYQKHILESKLDRFDSSLSERENMQANGYHRVYDSGNLVFAKLYLH